MPEGWAKTTPEFPYIVGDLSVVKTDKHLVTCIDFV